MQAPWAAKLWSVKGRRWPIDAFLQQLASGELPKGIRNLALYLEDLTPPPARVLTDWIQQIVDKSNLIEFCIDSDSGIRGTAEEKMLLFNAAMTLLVHALG